MHVEVLSNGIRYTFTDQGFTAGEATHRYSDIMEFKRGENGLKLAASDERGSVRYYKIQFPIDKSYAMSEIESLYFQRDNIPYTIATQTPDSSNIGNAPSNTATPTNTQPNPTPPTNNHANPTNQQLLSLVKDIREDVRFFKTLAIVLLCLNGIGLLVTVATISGSNY